jgi:hypothetical protein
MILNDLLTKAKKLLLEGQTYLDDYDKANMTSAIEDFADNEEEMAGIVIYLEKRIAAGKEREEERTPYNPFIHGDREWTDRDGVEHYVKI